MMTIDTKKIEGLIEAKISGARARVVDLDGGGQHWEVSVVTDSFEGMGLVDRHRMVYAALGSLVGNEMHAVKLVTLTKNESKGNNHD